MRITGGTFTGRTVKVGRGSLEIRPAMDRMRESLFSILGDLTGASFCDLFSGSGIIALEAASRGASPITCVEKDPDKRKTLMGNVSIVPVHIEVRIQPVELFVKRTKERFDYVFCDPPFPYAWKRDLVKSVADSPILKPRGMLVIHYPKENILQESEGPLTLVDKRNYGRSIVNFYKNTAES